MHSLEIFYYAVCKAGGGRVDILGMTASQSLCLGTHSYSLVFASLDVRTASRYVVYLGRLDLCSYVVVSGRTILYVRMYVRMQLFINNNNYTVQARNVTAS